MKRLLVGILLLPGLAAAEPSGREIMDRVYARHHHYPFVYEEQSMVLIDRNGRRETRRLRRYTRLRPSTAVDFLLLFDSPADVAGVAVLAKRAPDGRIDEQMYLPAFGRTLIRRLASDEGGHVGDESFLGTDYSVENIAGEELSDYVYVRREDTLVGEVAYHVIDVYLPDGDGDISSVNPVRRHYVQAEIQYVTRTDHFDGLGRLKKRMTHHDLVPVLGDLWRANMMLMENFEADHQTLIKIDRRVFSADYVPDEVFTAEWLFTNVPPLEPEDALVSVEP